MDNIGTVGLGRLSTLVAMGAASMASRSPYVLQAADPRSPYDQLADIRRAIGPRPAGERHRAVVNRAKVQLARKANVARLRAARA